MIAIDAVGPGCAAPRDIAAPEKMECDGGLSMKFALVLVTICSTHHCLPTSHPVETKLYSSYRACWLRLVPKIYYSNGKLGKWKCVSRVDPVAQKVAASGATTGLSTSEVEPLLRMESGGDARRVNRFAYAGLFQFGAPLLADLGLYSPGPEENLSTWSRTGRTASGKWSGTFSIPGFPTVRTLSDFLANPAAQFVAFRLHRAAMEQQIAKRGLDGYLDREIAGTMITRTGLLYMIHLGGAGGAQRVLRTHGRTDPRDANGTSLLDYARVGAALDVRNEAKKDAADAGPIAGP